MNVAKKKDVRYPAAVLLYAVIIMYKCVQMTVLQARILQNAAYVILLLVTLLFMKLTGKAFKDFGLYFGKLHIQIGIGAASWAVFISAALFSLSHFPLNGGFI